MFSIACVILLSSISSAYGRSECGFPKLTNNIISYFNNYLKDDLPVNLPLPNPENYGYLYLLHKNKVDTDKGKKYRFRPGGGLLEKRTSWGDEKVCGGYRFRLSQANTPDGNHKFQELLWATEKDILNQTSNFRGLMIRQTRKAIIGDNRLCRGYRFRLNSSPALGLRREVIGDNKLCGAYRFSLNSNPNPLPENRKRRGTTRRGDSRVCGGYRNRLLKIPIEPQLQNWLQAALPKLKRGDSRACGGYRNRPVLKQMNPQLQYSQDRLQVALPKIKRGDSRACGGYRNRPVLKQMNPQLQYSQDRLQVALPKIKRGDSRACGGYRNRPSSTKPRLQYWEGLRLGHIDPYMPAEYGTATLIKVESMPFIKRGDSKKCNYRYPIQRLPQQFQNSQILLSEVQRRKAHPDKNVSSYRHAYQIFQEKEGGNIISININSTVKDMRLSVTSILKWFATLSSLKTPVEPELTNFYFNWSNFLHILPRDNAENFYELTMLPVPLAVEIMGATDGFIDIFWPFRLDVNKQNQKLGLHGINSAIDNGNGKINFFNVLRYIQRIPFPFEEDRVVLSFDNPALVDGLNRTGLVTYSNRFIYTGKHLFNASERLDISTKTRQAMQLINDTSPELYEAITQLVGCIAFYKSETPGYISGTIPNTIGVIWIDPSAEADWTVPFYAELIVHEFIHTTLFYAELVHTSYAKFDDLTKVKTVSAIRRELRDYDRSFHAAYVSAGLVTFHSRAGFSLRAEELANTLRSSVDELVEKNKETHILSESGNAMLQFLADYIRITRMQR